jgi:ABC-2 type transport system permease protein
MKILSIAWKDLQIFFKDRGKLFYLILLPLLFIIFFSGILGAINSQPQDERIPLPVVDLDGGTAAQDFLIRLEAAGGLRLENYAKDQAEELLNNNELPRALFIPAGFSQDLASGIPVTIRLVSHPDASSQETEAVRLVIEGVVNDLSLETLIFASLEQMSAMMANSPQTFQLAFSTDKMQNQARSQFEAAQSQSLVTISQTIPNQQTEEASTPSTAQAAVPGSAVLFIFLTAQNTALSIYDEKKVGSFRRLLAAPMNHLSILIGKMLPNFITSLIQAVIIFTFGIYGFRLLGQTPTSLGSDPLGLILAVMLIALCSSTLGILIASLAHTENQIGGLSNLVLWVFGALGGSIIPIFILDRYAGPVVKIIPHYWANRLLNNLMIRGLSLADILPEMAILLGFSLLFFAIGLWRFDFE